MNPIELHLKNFTSYKDETINLDGIDIAVATGDNGAGKSSFATDAITWCLFGEGSKGGKKNMNDYVKRGEQEGRVELQFRLGNDLYKVVRHRSVAKDKTLLEFFIWGVDPQDGTEKWIARNGEGINKTQEIIEQTLRMDYRTFISSSLILQGKADSFTSDMTDAERKEALARILGLDLWDKLQDKVKAGAKQLRDKLAQVTIKKEPLLYRVETGKSVKVLMTNTKELLSDCETQMHSLQNEIDSINAQIATIRSLQDKWNDLLGKRGSLLDEQQHIKEEISAYEGKITRIKLVLECKEDVLKAIETEKELTAKIADIEKELAKKPLLEQQMNDIGDKIKQAEAEISKLKAEAYNVSIDLMGLKNIISTKDDILEACEQEKALSDELREHEQASAKYMELSKSMEKLYQQASEWKAKHDSEIAGIKAEIQAKQPLVDTLGKVPCSGTEKQTCPLLANARSAEEDLINLNTRLEHEAATINPYREDYVRLSEERKQLNYDAKKHTACKELLEEVRKTSSLKAKLDAAEARKADLEKRDAEIQQRLKEIEISEDQKQKLSSLALELMVLNQKESELPAYRRQLEEAQKLSGKKADLDKHEALLPEVESLLENTKSKLSKVDADITEIENSMFDTSQEINKLKSLSQSLDEKSASLRTLKAAEAQYRTDIGRYEQSLKDAAAAEEELAEIEASDKDLRSDLSIYELLDQACGKKSGVPALIIENAVPEIERLANDMLNRVTGGRMQLRLDTQIEGKSTGTMQDVLRITILDGGMPGPYQTFSGAERFMIDISLRVAISKFLAHRAGAEIKLLVIDEGFGSLDASGRQKILSVIDAVRQDFAKVIIITHLEELKDAFPRRIEVTKGPDGSKVNVA